MVLCFLMVALPQVDASDEPTCLRLGVIDTPLHRDGGAALMRFFEEAGLCHTLGYYPERRLDALVEAGILHGQAFRTDYFTDTQERSSAMVRVPTPILESQMYLVSSRPIEKTGGVYNNLTLARQSGSKWVEQFVGDGVTLIELDSFESGFTLLERDRIDGFFAPKIALDILRRLYFDCIRADLGPVNSHILVRAEFSAQAEEIDAAFRAHLEAGRQIIE